MGAPDALERGGVRQERPHAARPHPRRTHLGEPQRMHAPVQLPRSLIGAAVAAAEGQFDNFHEKIIPSINDVCKAFRFYLTLAWTYTKSY